jgi:hypothetical protein
MSLINDSSIETLIEEIEKRPALYKKKLKTIFEHKLQKKICGKKFVKPLFLDGVNWIGRKKENKASTYFNIYRVSQNSRIKFKLYIP